MKDKNKDSSESAHGNKLCPACGARVPDDAPAKMCPSCLAAQIMLSQNSVTTAAFIPPSVEELQLLIPGIEVKSMLGHGGMGAVYKGLQTSLGRAVAIKLLPLELSEGDPTFEERFRREAQTMAKLDHPNIVTIYDFGETVEGQCYIIMEYIEGSNLYELIHGGDISSAEALALIPQICNGLQYAHDHGVVHRDIKPANILISRMGKVKLTDFGLAKLLGDQAGQYELTMTGAAMGTPHYSAPEQAQPYGVIDHRADIYSLGVVLYELLTGQIPRGVFEPPSKKKIEIDVCFDEVVIRAMQSDPERRYQQVSEIKSQVDEACQDAARDVASPEGFEAMKRSKAGSGRAQKASNFPQQQTRVSKAGRLLLASLILFMLLITVYAYRDYIASMIYKTFHKTSFTTPRADLAPPRQASMPYLDPLNPSLIKENSKPLKFDRGSLSTRRVHSIVSGESDGYTFQAKPGQRISVAVTSGKDDAVITILYRENSKWAVVETAEKARVWHGKLPESVLGKYKIIVGSNSGKTTYELFVGITAVDVGSAAQAPIPNPSPIKENSKPLKFDQGSLSTRRVHSIVSGESDGYTFQAKPGQRISVAVTSGKDDAVITILYRKNSKWVVVETAEKARVWHGKLPESVLGKYKIIVGSNRGKTTYELFVGITVVAD
jgi:predicted Ser/Thr protein kinase